MSLNPVLSDSKGSPKEACMSLTPVSLSGLPGGDSEGLEVSTSQNTGVRSMGLPGGDPEGMELSTPSQNSVLVGESNTLRTTGVRLIQASFGNL